MTRPCLRIGKPASMGPRPIGRGNRQRPHEENVGHAGFNGAATNWSRKSRAAGKGKRRAVPLQWGRDQLVAEIQHHFQCLEAQMVLQWGRDQLVAEILAHWLMTATFPPLQWGRDQLVAEIVGTSHWRNEKTKASMGPRPIGRGNQDPLPRRDRIPLASMGPRPIGRGNPALPRILPQERPASMGPRPIGRGNHYSAKQCSRYRPASMGPRPIGRGNIIHSVIMRTGSLLLQWGRDQLVAEIAPASSRPGDAGRASMGPRPIGRGNHRKETLHGSHCHASMGPRPIGRGNRAPGRLDWPPARGFNGAATNWSRKS